MTLKPLILTSLITVLSAAIGSLPAAAQSNGSHIGHKHAQNTHASGSAYSPAATPKSIPAHVFSEAPEDHSIGDALAPHTLIVYASVVCGHCGSWFSNDYPILKERLIDTGKLRLVFREFPTQPSEVAVFGFQIANCAPEESYFDALIYQFENQDETFAKVKEGEGRARFMELAQRSGLTTETEMLSCLQNPAGLKRIENSMERALAGNIDAVPALILDGVFMPGLNGAKEVLDALGENSSR